VGDEEGDGGGGAAGGETTADPKDPKKKIVRGIVRGIFPIKDGNAVLTNQPRYRGLVEWDTSDIDKVQYTGSRDTATVHKAIEHKTEPLMKEGACSIS